MKTIVIYELPTMGHVNPIINLAVELKKQGNKVILYTGKKCMKAVQEAGIEFGYYGEELDNILDNFDSNGELLYAISQAIYGMKITPILVKEIEKISPDCILYDFMCTIGKQIAQITKIPAVTFYPCFYSNMEEMKTGHQPLTGEKSQQQNELFAMFNKHAQILAGKYGIDVLKFQELFSNQEPLNLICATKEFQPNSENLPSSFKLIGPSIKTEISSSEDDFDYKLLADKKVIYISMETVCCENELLTEQLLTAFQDSEYTVVMADPSGKVGRDYKVPENFIVKPFVPQFHILKHVAACISNGGFNTVSEAIYNNVPMLIIPQGADNFVNGFRVQNLKMGKVLMKQDVNSVTIRKEIDGIISGQAYDKEVLAMHSKQFREAQEMKEASEFIMQYIDGGKEHG